MGVRRHHYGISCLDPPAYLMFPVPTVAVDRAYGTLCAISVYTFSNTWTKLNIRFCISLFSWELCVGLRWDVR